MKQAPTISAADVIDRAAELLEDCGWSPNALSGAAPYSTYGAVQAACVLLRDEAPNASMPASGAARRALKERLGVDSLFEWEMDLDQEGVVAALRSAAATLRNREARS